MDRLNLDKVRARLYKKNSMIDGLYEFCGLGVRPPKPKPQPKPPEKPKQAAYVPEAFGKVNLIVDIRGKKGDFINPAGASQDGKNIGKIDETGVNLTHEWDYIQGLDESSIGEAYLDIDHQSIKLDYIEYGGSSSALSWGSSTEVPNYKDYQYPKDKTKFSVTVPGFTYQYDKPGLYIEDLSVTHEGRYNDSSTLSLSEGSIITEVSDVIMSGEYYRSQSPLYERNHMDVYEGDLPVRDYFSLSGGGLSFNYDDVTLVQNGLISSHSYIKHGFTNEGQQGDLDGKIAGVDCKMMTNIKVSDGINIDIDSKLSSYGEFEASKGDQIEIEDIVSLGIGNTPKDLVVKVECITDYYPTYYKTLTYSLGDVTIDGPNLIIPIYDSEVKAIDDISIEIKYSNIKRLKIGKKNKEVIL